MSQASGAYGQLLLGTFVETAYNYSATSMACVKLPINTSGIRASQNLVTPATILGRRSAAAPYSGLVDVRGTVTVPVDVNNIGYWLKLVFGSPTTTSGPVAGLWQHVYKVSSLASHVVEQGYTDKSEYFAYNGCKADSFSMSIRGDEELVASIDVIGGKETQSATSAMSGTTTHGFSRFTRFMASLQEGGADIATVTETDFRITNNLGADVYLIDGTPFRGDLPDGLCNASGRLRAQFNSASLYLHALSGTERSVQIKLATGSYQLVFNFDELLYQRQAPVIDGPGPIWLDMPWQAYYDNDADASVAKVTLINSVSAY